MASQRCHRVHRCHRRAPRRHALRRACGTHEINGDQVSRSFRGRSRRKTYDLRVGPRAGVLRSACAAGCSAAVRAEQLPDVRYDRSYCGKRAISNEKDLRTMIITKKAIPRRMFVRGLGVTLSLPLLDSMIPALSAGTKPVVRLGFIYHPTGAIQKRWTPEAEGAGFEFSQ